MNYKNFIEKLRLMENYIDRKYPYLIDNHNKNSIRDTRYSFLSYLFTKQGPLTPSTQKSNIKQVDISYIKTGITKIVNDNLPNEKSKILEFLKSNNLSLKPSGGSYIFKLGENFYSVEFRGDKTFHGMSRIYYKPIQKETKGESPVEPLTVRSIIKQKTVSINKKNPKVYILSYLKKNGAKVTRVEKSFYFIELPNGKKFALHTDVFNNVIFDW